ncbi:MAG: hypothetical protein QM770_24540 [Tepidisphaeraceae bacterium]
MNTRTSSSSLRAAAGAIELSIAPGLRLGGFGGRIEPQEGSLDALHVRVLMLQRGNVRVAWASVDSLGFSTALDRAFRERVADVAQLPASHVIVSCTHTHSAPVTMPARGPSGVADVRWIHDEIINRTASLAADLFRKLQPVAEMRTGETVVRGLGYNRQDADEPIDERLLVTALFAEGGRPIATFVNYALHPVVIGARNLKCSADFPGYVCGDIESKLGGVALFINGSCGDVDPTIYRDVGRDAGTVEVIRKIGHTLGDAALAALEHRDAHPTELAIETTRVTVPLDPPPPLEDVQKLHDEFKQQRGTEPIPSDGAARGAMYQLAWAEDLLCATRNGHVPSTLTADMTALRIGPVRVLTFPFEIYSRIGLELRRQLAPQPVMLAAYTHGLIGYVATTKAKQQGGYGAGFSHRYFPELLTGIGIGADDELINRGVQLTHAVDELTRH